jgi:hypothetical protein
MMIKWLYINHDVALVEVKIRKLWVIFFDGVKVVGRVELRT